MRPEHVTPAHTTICFAHQMSVVACKQAGPHFADWDEMQKQGAVSMASAPLHISNEPVAVLTLASASSAAFEDE